MPVDVKYVNPVSSSQKHPSTALFNTHLCLFLSISQDQTETNPRFASGLIVSLANPTINKAFNPGPKFSDDDPTTATATLTVDTTEIIEGEYCAYHRSVIVSLADAISPPLAFVVIENGPSGSIFEKDFLITPSFTA